MGQSTFGAFELGGMDELQATERPVLPGRFMRAVDLAQVDFERGRVKPSWSLDASGGWKVWERERRSVSLQADLLNMTNRLNLINFSGLFSGTAVGAPRAFYVRLATTF